MKRILIGLLVIVVGLASVNLIKRTTESSDYAVKFHIYRYTTENLFDILLRRIPENLDTLMKVDIIEPYGKDVSLYKVDNDIFGGAPDFHYVVYDKDNHEINDLKSRFLYLKIDDPDKVDLDTIDSYSVDLLIFRQIFEPYFTSNEDIADRYARILAYDTDSVKFKRIKERSDVDFITLSNRKTGPPNVNEDELIKDLSFLTHLTRDEFVYWFYDKGLIKIHLTFKDGHVEKVTTERLGRLGVEIRHV
jgi:hypothetical protein